jgi:pyocin large subunit-like protein
MYSIVSRALRAILALSLAALVLLAGGAGFASKRQFDEHYQKHGREFGRVTQDEYLRLAQDLRDAPVGGPILEAIKPGGVISRFDRRKGYFGAYNRNGTIRTFFVPNDGERYFHRQATRPD